VKITDQEIWLGSMRLGKMVGTGAFKLENLMKITFFCPEWATLYIDQAEFWQGKVHHSGTRC